MFPRGQLIPSHPEDQFRSWVLCKISLSKSSVYPGQGLSRGAVLRAGCDLVSGSAADLTGHLPDPSPRTPAGNTRDHMALLPTSTFSTLGSLPLSHRDSRIQLFTQDGTPDATKLGKRLTPSCAGSFLLVRICLGQGLPPHRTLAFLQSSSQVSYLYLGQGSSFLAGAIGLIHSWVCSLPLHSIVSLSISSAPCLQ